MQYGSIYSGAQFQDISSEPKPTLILRSPETHRRLFLDDIHNGKNAAFFGDATHILPFIPTNRINDTTFIHVSEDRPIGINPFLSETDFTHVVDAFSAVWESKIPTPQLDMYMLTACLAVSEIPDASLFQIHYLLTSPEHRKRIISQLKDPIVRSHWELFDSMSPRDQNDRTSSVTNRLVTLVTDRIIRTMIAQTRTIPTDGILVVDLPDSERFNLIAALILSQVPGVAYIERPLLHIGPSIPIVSTQYLGAIPDPLLKKLLGTATILSARCGVVDAKILEPHFNLPDGKFRLTELPDGRAHLRLEETHTIFLEEHSYRARPSNTAKIKANTVQRFGAPRKVIDAKIDSYLKPTSD